MPQLRKAPSLRNDPMWESRSWNSTFWVPSHDSKSHDQLCAIYHAAPVLSLTSEPRPPPQWPATPCPQPLGSLLSLGSWQLLRLLLWPAPTSSISSPLAQQDTRAWRQCQGFATPLLIGNQVGAWGGQTPPGAARQRCSRWRGGAAAAVGWTATTGQPQAGNSKLGSCEVRPPPRQLRPPQYV